MAARMGQDRESPVQTGDAAVDAVKPGAQGAAVATDAAGPPVAAPEPAPASAAGARRARKRDRGAAAQAAGEGHGGIETARPASTRRHPAWAMRVWQRLQAEPSLALSLGYLLVSLLGLWANYWYYWQFKLPILEYMQASDYLVAGLRDPLYLLLLLGSTALAWALTWPENYRRRFPSRVIGYRRRWWGRMVFPQSKLLRWSGLRMRPETGIVFAVMLGVMVATLIYVIEKAGRIRDHDAGYAVRVTLSDAPAPLPGQARLLGTSSAYVFLWWPRQRLAEAVPIEAIARLQSVRAEPVAAKPAATMPAAAAPASASPPPR